MDINLVSEGLKFMVLGMVTVFLFLFLMVVVLKLQSKLISKFFSLSCAKNSNSTNSQNSVTQSNNECTLVAVITAAIVQFKKQNT